MSLKEITRTVRVCDRCETEIMINPHSFHWDDGVAVDLCSICYTDMLKFMDRPLLFADDTKSVSTTAKYSRDIVLNY